MNNLQNSAVKTLSNILSSRIDIKAMCTNVIQNDPITGSSLCEISFGHSIATVWVRVNGSIADISGRAILLVSGQVAKKAPKIDVFLKRGL